MKATEAKLLEFIKKSPQFVIPIISENLFLNNYSLTSSFDNRTGNRMIKMILSLV